jgi:hypothetical protein
MNTTNAKTNRKNDELGLMSKINYRAIATRASA